jgi:hypothetical protein
MYDGWKNNRAHSREWVDKTNTFINMLSHCQTLESRGVHVASAEMVYPTIRKRFQYTFVGSVICQTMRCGCAMARKCLKMNR